MCDYRLTRKLLEKDIRAFLLDYGDVIGKLWSAIHKDARLRLIPLSFDGKCRSAVS